ncbi:MAG: 5-methyltetrahydropteroyltriglutamate--homocysteine S-methyltransferase [Methylacidiphilales bacterium]|nr:5-methyltetrahydropteroyltriglutamate--homocysteine S-methyltransferase [Candidatus Methylacidiphilales bacterium]MDW8349893.1 5-methyltetrahydropteroyltriglutamate--homocysteine S-methyltransferase [Verrucomicrobiae bacterium]
MTPSHLLTHNLGFPRIGSNRELKRALESFWKGQSTADSLLHTASQIRIQNWTLQKQAGIQLIPSNDFSLYDQVLDMSCLLGNIPQRFPHTQPTVDLTLYFSIARGATADCCHPQGIAASEMTKWFDTNYHYIVPELSPTTTFKIATSKPFDEFNEALALGIRTKPVLLGPLTYLHLSKSQDPHFDKLSLLPKLLPTYTEILSRLAQLGAEWIQIDEPILVLDLDPTWKNSFPPTYQTIRQSIPNTKILLATYFGDLRDNAPIALSLPIDALHLDLARAPHQLDDLLPSIPANLSLSLGVVDGRNIWRNDYTQSLSLIQRALQSLGPDRLLIAPSCSLLHSPISLRHETKLDPQIKSWLAFAEEKLHEITALAQIATHQAPATLLQENQSILQSRRNHPHTYRPEVRSRLATLRPEDARRHSPFPIRQQHQRAALHLTPFPTTTIGSFPQTPEIRQARLQLKNGQITQEAYNTFIRQKIAECIRIQEDLGIDVLVHGEFERNDMVEYFGELLDGFIFTQNGWVQSYGSRCVKPPIIYGDVHRPHPMTVEWTTYAQSLTSRPVKGMLTGPVTILQWSFVRDDIPRSDTARQIALAIRDEVIDLEKAGIRIIQIDEPAFREGLPLRQADRPHYLQWAIEAFRIASSPVADSTQIHTHMCYSEFNDIIESIGQLDADVISIETSRSNMELLDAFTRYRYPNEIGPGVWDIHSPRVPTVEEMTQLLEKAASLIPPHNLWVNPDCGLKTRNWPEVQASLKNMVTAAHQLRQKHTPTQNSK